MALVRVYDNALDAGALDGLLHEGDAFGHVIATSGLTLMYQGGVPVSLKNAAGVELLSSSTSDGFYLLESNNTKRCFSGITQTGPMEYSFSIPGSPEQFTVDFGGTNDYLTARLTSLGGFALAGERLYFGLNAIGGGLKAMALDYMVAAANTSSGVRLERVSLWETSHTNALGAFALYEFVDAPQEDEALLDLWTKEGLPHPKVTGDWNRATAEAWLDDWIAMAYDTSYLNIVPDNLAGHSDFLPYAEAMDAKAIYLWNRIWRGEYWLLYRQNDEINPDMYPNGQADLLAFKTASGRSLMLHYLCGNIGEVDPEFSATTVSPDLQSWGTVKLNAPVSSSASTMIVVPDAGVEMPIISTSSRPAEAPPVIPSFFEFKTFRIGSEWISASSVTNLGNGTWQLDGVSRGKWSTTASAYPAGASLRGYLRPYNQDFVPDPNSPLFDTIATRWAALNNTLGTTRSEFDGFENHGAAGIWGKEKFAARVYENLDHPTTANTSAGVPPEAWLEYRFNRVKAALGGVFQTRRHAGLFLGDKSRITPGLEEIENDMNKFLNVNNRGFSLGSYDVTGVTASTLANHGLTADVLQLLKDWKNASLPMSSVQRTLMDDFRPCPGARVLINGNHEWATALWRLDGSVFRKWHALGTDIYTHEWHFGQEHGTITPRFYLKNGDVQTLEVPTELASGADRVRIVGRVLPRYDAGSGGNIDLMGYLGGSPLAVARSNSTASDVWNDTGLAPYAISPVLDLSSNRGLGLWVTGDGSGATLIIRLHRGGQARDHAVPINFSGRQWIEIPTGEQAWRVKDWGWTIATRQTLDYRYVDSISIGIGHVPANTSCSVLLEGLTALAETGEALVSPTITLGDQSIHVSGTISTGNHFTFDSNGTLAVYDERWNLVSMEQFACGLLPASLSTFIVQSDSSSNIWLEVGVQASNETIANPDPNPPVIWDGGGIDDSWTTAENWGSDRLPAGSNNVVIGSGAWVENGQNSFASLRVDSGATVVFGTDTVSGGKMLTIAGTLDCAGTFRLIDSSMNLSGNLGKNINFLDTGGSTINFVAGAAFAHAAMDFQHKGSNIFGYTLSPAGFTTLVAGVLRSGNGAAWSNVTYNIDLSRYDIGNGATIILADYAGHDAEFDGLFNPTVNISAGAGGLTGSLAFDPLESRLVLTVDYDPINWDGGGSDDSWNTAANWNPDGVPGADDYVNVGPGATVTEGRSAFRSLTIQAGATVSFNENLFGNIVRVAGAMDLSGVFRIINSTVELSGSLGPNITFLDTDGSEINFADGATFGNALMPFEHKGANTFGYKLSDSGFAALTAGHLYSGNNEVFDAVWTNATYNIDLSAYSISNGATIVLADYDGHDAEFDGLFNPTVNILAGSSGLDAALSFDTAASRLILTVVPAVTGNGTPHRWLNEYNLVAGGDYEAADLLDADGDGLLNWQEYVAGTDPTNSGSVLRLTGVASVDNGWVFDWQSVSGKTYNVLFKTNLLDSVWTVYESGVPGTGASCVSTVETGSATGFIRIDVEN
jgi:hypothetical protein